MLDYCAQKQQQINADRKYLTTEDTEVFTEITELFILCVLCVFSVNSVA